MNAEQRQPRPEALAEAKLNPGGWVYEIEEAIVGAWQVDESGNIVGEFKPNPNHQPQSNQQG